MTSAPLFSDRHHERSAARLGMWIFLLTEALLFGSALTAYFVYYYLYAHDFQLCSRAMNVALGTANTLILIFSSLLVALAHHAAERQERWTTIFLLVAASVLGLGFLSIKGYEYYEKVEEHLVPAYHFEPPQVRLHHGEETVTPQAAPSEIFFTWYFVLTGLHAVHMLLGIGVLMALICMVWMSDEAPAEPVELAGLYWHFVDIVWIFLYPLLYLTGQHL